MIANFGELLDSEIPANRCYPWSSAAWKSWRVQKLRVLPLRGFGNPYFPFTVGLCRTTMNIEELVYLNNMGSTRGKFLFSVFHQKFVCRAVVAFISRMLESYYRTKNLKWNLNLKTLNLRTSNKCRSSELKFLRYFARTGS